MRKKEARDLLRSLVILPELLRELEEREGLPRVELKIILTVWLLNQTRFYTTAAELNAISTTFKVEFVNRAVNRGYLRMTNFKTNEEKGKPPNHYELTGMGEAFINRVNEIVRNSLKNYEYLRK